MATGGVVHSEPMDHDVNHTSKSIQSVERALTVLEVLGRREAAGLSQITQESGLSKATVYRLLSTMQRRGFVRQLADSSKYALGWKVVELSGRMLEGAGLLQASRGRLERLSVATQEAVHLGVLDGDEIVYINKVDSPQPIRIASRIGARVCLHCTALGKTILAWLSRDTARRLLGGRSLATRTPRTKTDIEEVLRELDITRRRGFALDEGENEEGIICLAAPVFDNRLQVCAAVSISGPEFRFDHGGLTAVAGLVQECAREISVDLGCPASTYHVLVPPASLEEVDA